MSTETSSAETDIRRLENLRYEAIVSGDLELFSSLCHPELIYTHSNGERDSLQTYLEKCRNGYYTYHEIEHPIEKIVVTGTVAVVAGSMRASLTAGGQKKELNNSSLAVWAKEHDTWKFLAYQPTVIPAAKPAEPVLRHPDHH